MCVLGSMKKSKLKLPILILLVACGLIWLIQAPLLGFYLTHKIGMNISVESVKLRPNSLNLRDFVIKNPDGFKGNAFASKEIRSEYRVNQLFSNPTTIDCIEIKDSTIRISFKNSKNLSNNWAVLGQNISKRERVNSFVIHKLILTNLDIEIEGANVLVPARKAHFDHLEFNDINSEAGFPTELLLKLIFRSGGIEQYIQDLMNPTQTIQKLLSPQKIFKN